MAYTTITTAQVADTTARLATSHPGFTIGINAGINQLYGDLSSPVVRPAFGLSIAYPLSRVVGLTLLGDLGTLRAQQAPFYNSVAKASYTQAALGGSVNLTRLFQSDEKRKQIFSTNALSFYLALGLIFFDATAYSLTNGQIQRYTNGAGSHRTKADDITATGKSGIASTHELVIPVGLRYSKWLTTNLSLYGDLRYNVFNTDKLDATIDNDNTTVSTPGGGDIYGRPASRNSRDAWASLSIGIAYRFYRSH
ncbi:hypothetical protein [Fibrella aquatica]|uniref:hypothetical protein n=1 Tax=Fibrella aquatica TaxID=3242487 RepID=UPI003520A31B